MTENWKAARMPVFTKHQDSVGGHGRITVDHFYPVIRVSGKLIDQADGVEHRRADNTVRFKVSNGSAVYAIVATNHVTDEYLCELVEGSPT